MSVRMQKLQMVRLERTFPSLWAHALAQGMDKLASSAQSLIHAGFQNFECVCACIPDHFHHHKPKGLQVLCCRLHADNTKSAECVLWSTHSTKGNPRGAVTQYYKLQADRSSSTTGSQTALQGAKCKDNVQSGVHIFGVAETMCQDDLMHVSL